MKQYPGTARTSCNYMEITKLQIMDYFKLLWIHMGEKDQETAVEVSSILTVSIG